MKIIKGAFAGALVLSPPAFAGLELSFPLDCELGTTCFIQQYVDHDQTPGAQDFTCGGRTYDGHKGTDIRLPSRAAMRGGINILAAAAGVIVGTRSNMDDIPQDAANAPDISGKDCGNGARLDHGDGWETQYCHMKKGSIVVRSGQKVATGQPLGQVGLSGFTEFPHLHISVRKDGQVVDPFAPSGNQSCKTSPLSLWSPDLPDERGGILSAGFKTAIPDYSEVRDGPTPIDELPTDAPAIVVWAFVYSLEAGDRLVLKISSPDGTEFATSSTLIDRNRAQEFRATGRKRPSGGWPSGDYQGSILIVRQGQLHDQQNLTLRVTDSAD